MGAKLYPSDQVLCTELIERATAELTEYDARAATEWGASAELLELAAAADSVFDRRLSDGWNSASRA